MSDEDKTELINEYLDSLDIKLTTVNSEIDSDDESSQVRDAIKIINSVNSGETIIEKYDKEEDK